jgi:hypothetical protein
MADPFFIARREQFVALAAGSAMPTNLSHPLIPRSR